MVTDLFCRPDELLDVIGFTFYVNCDEFFLCISDRMNQVTS